MGTRVLVCWVGLTDLRCARGEEDGLGPTAQALTQRAFDRALLLANCSPSELKQYLQWAKPKEDDAALSEQMSHMPNLEHYVEHALLGWVRDGRTVILKESANR